MIIKNYKENGIIKEAVIVASGRLGGKLESSKFKRTSSSSPLSIMRFIQIYSIDNDILAIVIKTSQALRKHCRSVQVYDPR